jgi:hypothetical protein
MSNNTDSLYSFIVEDEDRLPLHLKHRTPSFTLKNVTVVFKHAPEKVCPGGDGKVQMAGAVEFQASTTPGLLADYCDPGELHSSSMRTTHRFRVVYDPEIQRGVKETKGEQKEFLRESHIESMMVDIEKNQFECPQLNWNLRASETIWVYLTKRKELRVYQGVATRPDTNHRHHAIIRFHKKYLNWVETTESTSMGDYNSNREYGLIIYTDDFEQEAHRFYVYNFLGWRVSTSTAHYIESKTRTPALHAKLARQVMEQSGILGTANVEIISNHLSRNSAKMLTFGTLVDSLRQGFAGLTEEEVPETVNYLIKFVEELHRIRPAEIAVISVAQRKKSRDTTVVDQAVLWSGYLRLAAWLRESVPQDWQAKLQVLANSPFRYRCKDGRIWSGDLFSRNNPLWMDRGILAPGKTGIRVVHNRPSRQAAFEALKDIVSGKDFTEAVAVAGHNGESDELAAAHLS